MLVVNRFFLPSALRLSPSCVVFSSAGLGSDTPWQQWGGRKVTSFLQITFSVLIRDINQRLPSNECCVRHRKAAFYL